MRYGFRRRKYTATSEITQTVASPPVYVYIESWNSSSRRRIIDAYAQNVEVIEVNRSNALDVSVTRVDASVEGVANLNDKHTGTKARRLFDTNTAELEVVVFDIGSLVSFDGSKLIRLVANTLWVGTATDLIIRVYTSQDDVTYTLYTSGGGIDITTMTFPTCRYIKITVEVVGASGGGAYVNFSEPVVFDLSTGVKSTGASGVSHECKTQNDYMTVVITADTDVTYSAHYYDKTSYSEDEILLTEV